MDLNFDKKMQVGLTILMILGLVVCGYAIWGDHEGIVMRSTVTDQEQPRASDVSSVTVVVEAPKEAPGDILISEKPGREPGMWDMKVSFHQTDTEVFAKSTKPRLSYYTDRIVANSHIELQLQSDQPDTQVMLFLEKSKEENPKHWAFPMPSNTVRIQLKQSFFPEGARLILMMGMGKEKELEFERQGDKILLQ